MAYVTHGSYRPYRISRGRAAPLSAAAVVAALATAAAAVLIMALAFDVGATASGGGKGDRLAPPARVATASAPGAGAYAHDPVQRTTTVARDATIPLSPQSPLANTAE
ncbi:hypothetical protein GCM10008171_00200 [Methylopila jiangsuensis]|uniref:Uncharacterized protein n=1 Tax=Methylopila jiangsuensis TaxID=586230 RepID=A0A9W6JFT8_9HYPH|nr:hypothetical protein [Methylopila jiangsuensis]MDR6287273.1 hypothetical protein [Methylopila jiangsuensis]GLK74768.1 hypothetical protein GCM10008171_00200 [Methylopila jiangsuensis]